MLTFMKGHYTLRDLALMHDALEAGFRLVCHVPADTPTDCDKCENCKVCRDLLSANNYISTLLSKETKAYSEYLAHRPKKT